MKNYLDKSGQAAKIGKVRVKVKDDGALYVAYWSTSAGKMITERANGDNYNAALKHAAKVNAQLNKKAPSIWPSGRTDAQDDTWSTRTASRSSSSHPQSGDW